ncbi:MAG: hypothetical protein Q8R20_03225, partial [Nanoarchaeota archaeon]|nr:hypothetical protein [Nanoarchaeota archaeon]
PNAAPATKEKWDGKWRIVSFDVPGGYRLERNMIRSLLKASHFYRLHKSVWASPSHLSQNLWKTLVRLGLHEYCKVMLVEILEGDEELRDHFRL